LAFTEVVRLKFCTL